MDRLNFIFDIFSDIGISSANCACVAYDDYGTRWVAAVYMEVEPD